MESVSTGVVALNILLAGLSMSQRAKGGEPAADPPPRVTVPAIQAVPRPGVDLASSDRADNAVSQPGARIDPEGGGLREVDPGAAAEPLLAQMGTAFSYQGFLEVDGSAHTGTCDFRFRLYTVASGGTSIGSTLLKNGVQVDAGLYEETLNFGGSTLFNGEARWLQIDVKCPPDTGYTALSPRHELLPTPYALALPGMHTVENATSSNVFGGYYGNWSLSGTVGVTVSGGGASGADHFVSDSYGTIGGGRNNFVGNGTGTTSDAQYATVGGGVDNQARDAWATVAGGDGNVAGHKHTTVGGGLANNAAGDASTIAGGWGNTAGSSGTASTIGGGRDNLADNFASTVAGGYLNRAEATRSTAGGGESNELYDPWCTIGGGLLNKSGTDDGDDGSAQLATVAGGWLNEAAGPQVAIGGGGENSGYDAWSTIAGGLQNHVGSDDGDILSSCCIAVGGGWENVALGSYSTIPGGYKNFSSFPQTFAAGSKARAIHQGSFVWADANLGASQRDANDYYRSTQSNDFSVLATGGVVLDVNNGRWVNIWDVSGRLIRADSGAYLSTGGTWVNASDETAKEGFASVNPREILDRVAVLPIRTWSYREEDSSTRHLGPTAQDFAEAFGLGDSDTTIATLDADGVALSAIQGLYDLVREKEATISNLEARLARLEREIQKDGTDMGDRK